MPCLINNIQCNDEKLQQLFCAIENAVSLSSVVVVGWQLAKRLAVLLIEELLVRRAQGPTEWLNCPMCGKKLQSKGFAPRQIATIIGVIRFKRRVGRCPSRCQIGVIAPLDTELQLTPHQRSCNSFKRLACLLTVFVPFKTATALLNQLMGISVSASTVWQWVQNAGQRAISTLNDQILALSQGVPVVADSIDPSIEELPLLIGADGVMVPFRPESGLPKGRTIWREVKVAIVTRFRPRPSKSHNDTEQTQTELVRRRLVACLGDIDDLGQRLWLEALRGGITTAKPVVWLSDGARGFWRLFQTYFADLAIGILDFYHVAQNLSKAAKSVFDGRTKKARAWFESARHRLRHGPTMRVRRSVEKASKDQKLPKAAQKVLSNLLDYLDGHQNHIPYHQFKAMGLPIGSGMVESACKWLIPQRFKGVGMRWSENGFNALVHLRLAWTNERFDDLFTTTASPN